MQSREAMGRVMWEHLESMSDYSDASVTDGAGELWKTKTDPSRLFPAKAGARGLSQSPIDSAVLQHDRL